MKRSLSEIRSTCLKAARGAGCPWGLAEEAGEAARCLQAQGVPAVAALAALLTAPRACSCGGGTGPACGIFEAAAWSDRPQEMRFPALAAPVLLIAPMLAEGGWRIEWPGGAVTCAKDGLLLEGGWPNGPVPVVVTRTMDLVEGPEPSVQACTVAAEDWAKLEALAAKTYVPETETSRATGAGPDSSESD